VTRDKSGRFVKKSIAAKAKALKDQGLTNAQIAKTLGVRPQNVFRALNRARFQVKRVAVAKVKQDPEACTNELCLNGTSKVCECPCQGAGHGTALQGILGEDGQYHDPTAYAAIA